MRFLALMLLLIGGASAGAAWQRDYGWEDLRCSIEENRWGCADTVSVTRAPRSPERWSAPTPLTDRTSCEEVRGTEYRSPTERKWFLANCVTPAAPVVEEELPSLIDDLPPYDLPPLCDDYNDTEHWTGAELDEFMQLCGCWATDISFPPCRAYLTLVAAAHLPGGSLLWENVVRLDTVPVELMNGERAVGYEVLGRRLSYPVRVGEPILLGNLCPVERCGESVPLDEIMTGFPSCDDARSHGDPRAWVTGVWQWFTANCFSCEVSGSSPVESERRWFEQTCLSQEPAPPSEPSASSGEHLPTIRHHDYQLPHDSRERNVRGRGLASDQAQMS